MPFIRQEEGVMVMKDGKGWGVTYRDGRVTEMGWLSPEHAPIHDPRYCKKPTDVLSHYDKWDDLDGAQLVQVVRTTKITVEIKP